MQQSISSTLASGQQAGENTPKVASDLVTELMNAHAAKGQGDMTTQMASLLRAEMAARGDLLKEQKSNAEAQIKAQEKINELMMQLVDSGQSDFLLKSWLNATKDEDWNTLDMLAPIMKELNEEVYKEGMNLRAIAASKNPETGLFAHLGAADEVQKSSHALENQETFDNMTQEQMVRHKQATGQSLYDEERAIELNRGQKENPFKKGQGADPAAAFMRDTTETPEKDDVPTKEAEWQAIMKRLEEQGATEEQIKEAHDRHWNIDEPDEESAKMRDWQKIEAKLRAEGKTDEEINERYDRYWNIDKQTPNTNQDIAQQVLDKYASEENFDNHYLMEFISNKIGPKNEAERFVRGMDRFLRGRTFEQLEKFPKIKEAAAKFAVQEIMQNIEGGEIVKRHLRVMELLRVHLPEIMKTIDDLRERGVDLGKVTSGTEKIFQFTGATNNPEVARLNTRIKDLVASFVALRSGAQVTEQERKLYTDIFSQIGRGYELNRAVIDGLMDNVRIELGNIYNTSMGKNWGGYATQLQFDPGEVSPVQHITYISPEEFEQSVINIQKKDPTRTRAEIQEQFRKKNIRIR